MVNKLYEYIDNIHSHGLGKDVWFMTKQTMTDFYMPFFIAEIVENYKTKRQINEGFDAFYSRSFRENAYTSSKFPKQSESKNTYRNAIIAEFFGLFYREKTGYDSGVVTPAYNVLKKYIKDHNDIKKYRFLVDRQIEKLCLNINSNARIYNDVKGVTIFPVIYLYKILIELNKKYGSSKLNYIEFLLFLVHAKKYAQWQETLYLIDIYRNNAISDEYKKKIESIISDGSMTNIRFDALFGTLENIEYHNIKQGNYYQIKQNEKSINYIQTVVDLFEHSDYVDCTDKSKLLTFMRSDKYFIGNLDAFSVIYVDKEENEMQEDIIKMIIDTYNNHNFDYNIQAQKYKLFKELYGKDKIANLEGKELLYRLFAPKKLSSEGLTYNIEFSNNYREFGGIGGRSAFKFPLFFSNQYDSWVTGKSNKSIKILSEESAIELATAIRDELVELFELVENTSFDSIDDYKNFEVLTYSERLLPKMWVLKYLHILYPEKFSCFYSDSWLNFMLNKLEISPVGGIVTKNGQVSLLSSKLEIPNVYLFKVLYELFPMVSDEELIEESQNDDYECINEQVVLPTFDFSKSPIKEGENIIVYGTPGCGKSYYVEHTLLKDYIKENCIRTTFFQDYTNVDFVGQILPIIEEDKVTYKFHPGPFTLALEEAIRKPYEKVALVIEELNRGSAASIFGDIFQLLDRKEGVSEYSIMNVNIINYLKERFEGLYTFDSIRLPGNLSIFATMNTSDQNVFTLDTAFKRRWKFKKLLNKFETDHKFKDMFIPGADITWREFVDKINLFILESSNGLDNEDKQLGVYFVDEKCMRKEKIDASDPQAVEDFAYKVLEYLWSDVAKFNRSSWFEKNVKSLDDLVDEYKTNGIGAFKYDVFNR